MQFKGVSAYLSQTAIGISNKIGFCKTAAINNSICSRVVVYRMTKKLGKLKPFQSWSLNTDVRLQFIAMAQSVSNLYERAPMSLEIALETISRKSVNFITSGMIIDPSATA